MSLMTVPILVLSLLYVPALGKGSPKRRGSLWFGGGGVLLTAVSHVCLALGTIWSYEDGAGRRGGGHTWSRRCFAFTLLLFGYYVYCLFEGTLSSYLTIRTYPTSTVKSRCLSVYQNATVVQCTVSMS